MKVIYFDTETSGLMVRAKGKDYSVGYTFAFNDEDKNRELIKKYSPAVLGYIDNFDVKKITLFVTYLYK